MWSISCPDENKVDIMHCDIYRIMILLIRLQVTVNGQAICSKLNHAEIEVLMFNVHVGVLFK